MNREISHVDRNVKSSCLACKGCRQGEMGAKAPEWSPLTEVSDNEKRKGKRKLRKQTWYGCRICDAAIRNNRNCWDFYHHLT
jgi:hypothetical protein